MAQTRSDVATRIFIYGGGANSISMANYYLFINCDIEQPYEQ